MILGLIIVLFFLWLHHFLRHQIAAIENQLVIKNNWVSLGVALTKSGIITKNLHRPFHFGAAFFLISSLHTPK